MTIGERIKQRRIELNMTQDELAKRTGYKSRSSINKLETARALPSRKIEKMAEALECRPAYLMGWTDSPIDSPIARVLAEKRRPTEDIERVAFNNTLTDNERTLIAAYRSADDHTRHMVEYALRIKEMTDADR